MRTKVIVNYWVFASSSSSGSGTWQALQYEDGSTSCDCPGWTRRVARDGSRSCKHTRYIESGIADSVCAAKRQAQTAKAVPSHEPQKSHEQKPFFHQPASRVLHLEVDQ